MEPGPAVEDRVYSPCLLHLLVLCLERYEPALVLEIRHLVGRSLPPQYRKTWRESLGWFPPDEGPLGDRLYPYKAVRACPAWPNGALMGWGADGNIAAPVHRTPFEGDVDISRAYFDHPDLPCWPFLGDITQMHPFVPSRAENDWVLGRKFVGDRHGWALSNMYENVWWSVYGRIYPISREKRAFKELDTPPKVMMAQVRSTDSGDHWVAAIDACQTLFVGATDHSQRTKYFNLDGRKLCHTAAVRIVSETPDKVVVECVVWGRDGLKLSTVSALDGGQSNIRLIPHTAVAEEKPYVYLTRLPDGFYLALSENGECLWWNSEDPESVSRIHLHREIHAVQTREIDPLGHVRLAISNSGPVSSGGFGVIIDLQTRWHQTWEIDASNPGA